jgi:hypothetical protein
LNRIGTVILVARFDIVASERQNARRSDGITQRGEAAGPIRVPVIIVIDMGFLVAGDGQVGVDIRAVPHLLAR